MFRKTDICCLNAAGIREGRFAGQEDAETVLWEKGLCLRVLCLPRGWSALWHKCYFTNIFISLPVLKLGVVELVLQNTDLRGAVDAQMLAWDVLLPVRGWSGSSKNTISSKIPPFSQASFEVIQVSLLKSLLQPRVYGHPRAILAITTKSHLCSLPFQCHWSFCMF